MRDLAKRGAVIVALLVMATSCGGETVVTDDDVEPLGTDAADTTVDDPIDDDAGSADSVPPDTNEPAPLIEEILREFNPNLGAVIRPEGELFSDISVTADLGITARELIAEVLALVPDVDDNSEIRAALLDWDADIGEAIATLETEQSTLQAEVTAWLESEPREGPPPVDYTDILDVVIFGHEPYKQACLDLAQRWEVALDCSSIDRDPGEGSPGNEGELSAAMGDIELTIDAGIVNGSIVSDGLLALELTPTTTLTFLVPPLVADPDSDRHFLDVVNPIEWPDDTLAWVEALPAVVALTDQVVLNGLEYETTRLAFAGEQFGIIANAGYPEGANVLSAGSVIQWWETTVDDQPIVVVMDSFGGEDVELLMEMIETILGSAFASGV